MTERERPGLPFFCPMCPLRHSTEETLTGHLIDHHGATPSEAAAKAGQVARDLLVKRQVRSAQAQPLPPEELPMARKCGNCQKPGHRADKCPQANGKRPAAKKATGGGTGPIHDALTALRKQRADCDTAIAALEKIG